MKPFKIRDIEINPKAVGAFVNRADVYETLKRYEQAKADYDGALEINPVEPHALAGACWVRAAFLGSELDRARSQCDKALEADPRDASVLDSRGMISLKQGRFQDAWNDYDAAIKLRPKDASYWYGRALAARALGRTADATSDIANAKMLDPKIAETYATYGIKP